METAPRTPAMPPAVPGAFAPAWGLSSAGEHLLCKQGVRGSNPLASTGLGPVAGHRKGGGCCWTKRRYTSLPPSFRRQPASGIVCSKNVPDSRASVNDGLNH